MILFSGSFLLRVGCAARVFALSGPVFQGGQWDLNEQAGVCVCLCKSPHSVNMQLCARRGGPGCGLRAWGWLSLGHHFQSEWTWRSLRILNLHLEFQVIMNDFVKVGG